jgi:hypothetical protein
VFPVRYELRSYIAQEYYLVQCHTLYSDRNLPMFRRDVFRTGFKGERPRQSLPDPTKQTESTDFIEIFSSKNHENLVYIFGYYEKEGQDKNVL